MKIKTKRKTVTLNTVILTQVKVKPINDVVLPALSSNKRGGYAISLGSVYVGDESQFEILETIFSRK